MLHFRSPNADNCVIVLITIVRVGKDTPPFLLDPCLRCGVHTLPVPISTPRAGHPGIDDVAWTWTTALSLTRAWVLVCLEQVSSEVDRDLAASKLRWRSRRHHCLAEALIRFDVISFLISTINTRFAQALAMRVACWCGHLWLIPLNRTVLPDHCHCSELLKSGILCGTGIYVLAQCKTMNVEVYGVSVES